LFSSVTTHIKYIYFFIANPQTCPGAAIILSKL